MKPVRRIQQINKEGKVLRIFSSTREIEIDFGVSKSYASHIHKVAQGKKDFMFGFSWKYEEEKDLVGEEWKIHTSGIIVSNMGRIQHKNGARSFGKVTPDGYLNTRISPKYSRPVHRLVLEAFSQPSELTVDHIDRNKHNNQLSNLRWATMKEQAQNRGVANTKHCLTCSCNHQ